MIQANCRARFTAADFDFIVRTLARSPHDHVSLVDLLSDAETRDAVLDHPRLVEAILSHAGHLSISSSFLFLCPGPACPAATPTSPTANSLIMSARSSKLFRAPTACARRISRRNRGRQYVSDMLIALTRATPEQSFLLRAHVGNYSLFISGIFHENAAAPQPARRARS